MIDSDTDVDSHPDVNTTDNGADKYETVNKSIFLAYYL